MEGFGYEKARRKENPDDKPNQSDYLAIGHLQWSDNGTSRTANSCAQLLFFFFFFSFLLARQDVDASAGWTDMFSHPLTGLVMAGRQAREGKSSEQCSRECWAHGSHGYQGRHTQIHRHTKGSRPSIHLVRRFRLLI